MKIGIITHYYRSTNYGGNLQAYALCRYINGLGYDCVQIQYTRKRELPFWKKNRRLFTLAKRLVRKIFLMMTKPIRRLQNRDVNKKIATRNRCILQFNRDQIPHTEGVYDCKSISKLNQSMQVFITGSDQVWHPTAVCNAYLLDFVNEDRVKLSYAASISVSELSAHQKETYQKKLKDYLAISVREQDAVQLLSANDLVPIEQVLDPTLLLSDCDWDEVCSERKIKGNYIFCYFLGDDEEQRHIVEQYAKERNLIIVTLPYLMGKYRNCDAKFGDMQLYEVSPADFISLVKFSEIVFTDSFHATVFSIIYKKQFFTFERSTGKSMGSRIVSLTLLFGLTERFLDTKQKMTMEYILASSSIDYHRNFPEFEAMLKYSKEFLNKNLEKAKEQTIRYED